MLGKHTCAGIGMMSKLILLVVNVNEPKRFGNQAPNLPWLSFADQKAVAGCSAVCSATTS